MYYLFKLSFRVGSVQGIQTTTDLLWVSFALTANPLAFKLTKYLKFSLETATTTLTIYTRSVSIFMEGFGPERYL